MSKTAAEKNAVPTENLPRTSCYDENKDAHMKELSLARLRRRVYRSARNESSKETVASPLEAKVLPHAPVSTTTMDDLPSPDRNSMDQISDKGNMECACQPGLRTLMAEKRRKRRGKFPTRNGFTDKAYRKHGCPSDIGYFSTEVCEHDK
ncbi:uncharacterized protein [Dermacentor albipictus]|uniref:uncharacterized protein n=1 Tax=Dermacentor albipictus TaxID=60249 RepID=UPI0031FD4E3E